MLTKMPHWINKIFLSFLIFPFLFNLNSSLAATETNMPENPVTKLNDSAKIITRLSNGLLVVIVQDKRFPLVCSRLYCRTGSANEDPKMAGISHLLEHMVFKGTSHRPKGQVAKDIEALGGYINAATSFDKTWYIADLPAAHWKQGIEVLKDMAFQATLDVKELESEKSVVISELQRGEDSPMRKLFESLQVASLKNTPYGRPIIGYENTIKSVTVEDLQNYVKKWYQPQNMMLLIAGDINPSEVLEYAQKVYGNLANSGDLPVPQPIDILAAADGSPLIEVIRGPWSKVYMGVAMPAPGIKSLRSIELDALCYLLGGDDTSIFYKKYMYDDRIVDNINVSNMSLAQAGMVAITAQLDAENAEKFWDSLTKELNKLSLENIDSEAISRAKFNILDEMDRSAETLNGLTSWLGIIEFDLGGEQADKNIRFALNNINHAQIQNAIINWFEPARARVRVFAPKDAQLPDFQAIMHKNWPAKKYEEVVTEQTASQTPLEEIDMGNGCQLLLIRDNNAPYISLSFIMTGGNSMLKPDQQGLANLTANLLEDGCGSMNKPQLEIWLAQRAASVSAQSGLRTFSISLTGPSRFNQDYFGLLLDILRKPKFDPAEYLREVQEIKAAIKMRNDQPLSYMFSKVNPFLFPDDQVYGYENLGTAESLDTFNVMNVRDFWTLQSGQPWALAVAGAFDREEIIKFAKTLPAPRSARAVLQEPSWTKDKTLRLTLPDRNQAHLMRIFKTVSILNEDAPALSLLQAILSGQSGPLFTYLRDEKGLGYTVTAFNRHMPHTGYMAFYIGTTAGKIPEAGKGFDEVIDRLKKDLLPAEELKAASNKLLGDYLRERQSLASRAAEASTNAILGYPQDFEKQMISKAAQLTPEDIKNLVNKYLNNPYDITLIP